MALNARQRLAYRNSADLWEPAYTIDGATQLQTATTYTLVASDVKCLKKTQDSIEGVGSFGRVEGDNQFSRDIWHFDIAQEIDSDWIIKDVTVDRNGTNSPHHGRYWVVSGEPQVVPALGGRNANLKRVQAVGMAVPPDGVS